MLSARSPWCIAGTAFVACAVLLLGAPDKVRATMPGQNGKFAFTRLDPNGQFDVSWEIYVMNADGTGERKLTQGPPTNLDPNWSPDGTKIAFTSNRDSPDTSSCDTPCLWELYVMDADGSNVHRVTFQADGLDGNSYDASWSPDGTRIALSRGSLDFAPQQGCQIWTIRADGTDPVHVPTNAGNVVSACYPSWSPDGREIAFMANGNVQTSGPLYAVRLDGTGLRSLGAIGRQPDWSPNGQYVAYYDYEGVDSRIHATGPSDPNAYGEHAAWSPDGRRIAFNWNNEIRTTNPDGTGRLVITNNDFADSEPSWQPILKGHVRPKGAQPLWISFVPAYNACVSPNRRHGGALAYDSCASPQTKSSRLTLGSPDANGRPVNSGGQAYMKLRFDNASTTTDETDVLLDAEITDVRKKSDLEDYTGELRLQHSTRITDRDNTPYPGGLGPGTTVDFGFAWTIPCASTSETTIGSRCVVSTSANSIAPGAVTKNKKAIWQVGDLQVYDGGADGLASTTGDNTLFEVQGVFVP